MTIARAVWHQVETSDHRLMWRVNRWRAPRPFRLLMIAATRLGDGWLWAGLGLILLVFGGGDRYAAVAAAGLAAASGVLSFRLLKTTSRRQRPCEIVPHCWSSIAPPDRYSFPSGHTITAFAVAMSIGPYYPALLPALLAAALLIATSRILLGMHFLSDVIVGATIGVTLGHASYHFFSTL